MIKEFFTLAEGASFLSSSDQVPVSKDDLLRLCEVQELPISFKYRGSLGAFSTYAGKPDSAKLFPTPVKKVYFDGYLASQNPCRLNDTFEHIRSLGQGRGHTAVTEVRNTLRPHKVEIRKTVHVDGALAAIDGEVGFWGRVNEHNGCLDSMSEIPEALWLLHISDLLALKGRTEPDPPGADLVLSTRIDAPASPDLPLHSARSFPLGGDSITGLIWEICDLLIDQGRHRFAPKDVMARLRTFASEPTKRHPLVGVVANGIKYEYETGDERELTGEQLRKRIAQWRTVRGLPSRSSRRESSNRPLNRPLTAR